LGIFGPLAPLLTIAALLSLPLYPFFQILVLFRRRGWSLVLSLVPVLPMLVLLVQALLAFQADSDLAPLLVIIASPLALLWLWLAGFVRR
jgi:hypothetical protein